MHIVFPRIQFPQLFSISSSFLYPCICLKLYKKVKKWNWEKNYLFSVKKFDWRFHSFFIFFFWFEMHQFQFKNAFKFFFSELMYRIIVVVMLKSTVLLEQNDIIIIPTSHQHDLMKQQTIFLSIWLKNVSKFICLFSEKHIYLKKKKSLQNMFHFLFRCCLVSLWNDSFVTFKLVWSTVSIHQLFAISFEHVFLSGILLTDGVSWLSLLILWCLECWFLIFIFWTDFSLIENVSLVWFKIKGNSKISQHTNPVQDTI